MFLPPAMIIIHPKGLLAVDSKTILSTTRLTQEISSKIYGVLMGITISLLNLFIDFFIINSKKRGILLEMWSGDDGFPYRPKL